MAINSSPGIALLTYDGHILELGVLFEAWIFGHHLALVAPGGGGRHVQQHHRRDVGLGLLRGEGRDGC